MRRDLTTRSIILEMRDRFEIGHTNTLSLNFYKPYDLPDAQLTVSKH